MTNNFLHMEFWTHSLTKALGCQLLSETLQERNYRMWNTPGWLPWHAGPGCVCNSHICTTSTSIYMSNDATFIHRKLTQWLLLKIIVQFCIIRSWDLAFMQIFRYLNPVIILALRHSHGLCTSLGPHPMCVHPFKFQIPNSKYIVVFAKVPFLCNVHLTLFIVAETGKRKRSSYQPTDGRVTVMFSLNLFRISMCSRLSNSHGRDWDMETLAWNEETPV